MSRGIMPDNFNAGRVTVGLLLLYVLVYLLPLDIRPLTIPDEMRYAEIPYEMLLSGDWVTPRLNGLRYFEKPPLGYWLNAVSISLLGQNGFAVRLATALAAGCTALLVYFFSLKLFSNRQASLLAAFIYLTFAAVYLAGSIATLDSLLTLFLSAGIMSYAAATLESRPGRAWLYWLGCGVALGFAFLVKGFLAFAVPVLVLVPWLIWHRYWRALLIRGWVVVLVAVILVLPWALLIHQREADFWHYFFWVEHIKRFSSENAQHKEPFYYFLMFFPVMAFPWVSLLPAAIAGHLKSINPANLVANRLLWLWMLLPFLFFSISSGKLATYILPCFPPLAIVIAGGLQRYFQISGRLRLFRWGVALNLLAMLALLLAVAYLQLKGDDDANYRSDEFPQLVALQLLIVAALLAGLVSLRRLDWRLRMASLLPFLLPVLAIATFSLPNWVKEVKAPGQLLLEVAPLIDRDTLIVSDGTMFRSLNWYLDRRDVYMLSSNEVAYGLKYPDSSHRLLSLGKMKRLIARRKQQPVALFCHFDCPRGISDLIPADAPQQSYGQFTMISLR